jgi:adenosine deaminase CECR1
MRADERERVTAEWTKKWQEFCEWIVEEYGSQLENWEPRPGRH